MIKEFPAKIESIPQIIDFIDSHMNTGKKSLQTKILTEECINKLLEHADSDAEIIRVRINKFLGNLHIDIYVNGENFDFRKNLTLGVDLANSDMSIETSEAISNLLIKSLADKLTYSHHNGVNKIRITIANKSPYTMLYYTLFAIAAAIITGLIMKNFADSETCRNFNDYILLPVHEIFMDGLKLCSVGIIFFSIASCITNLGGMSDLKKVGSVLIICFVIMHLISAFAGVGAFYAFKPFITVHELSNQVNNINTVSNNAEITLINFIANLIPENIVRPFLESQMLQLIVLGILIGYAAGAAGASLFRQFIDECNNIFMKIIGIFIKLIPLVVFCSITSMFLTIGGQVMISLLGLVITNFAIQIIVMILFFAVVVITCRLNPAKIFVKSLQMLITAFTTCSTNASIPDSMTAAQKMGVDAKIYSFSIPLSTALNKAGVTLELLLNTIAISYMFGVDVSFHKMLSMILPAIIFNIASPGIAGGVTITFAALIAMLGAPSDSIALYIAMDPIIDMFITPVICFGNVLATLFTASHAGMIDREIFNS